MEKMNRKNCVKAHHSAHLNMMFWSNVYCVHHYIWLYMERPIQYHVWIECAISVWKHSSSSSSVCSTWKMGLVELICELKWHTHIETIFNLIISISSLLFDTEKKIGLNYFFYRCIVVSRSTNRENLLIYRFVDVILSRKSKKSETNVFARESSRST